MKNKNIKVSYVNYNSDRDGVDNIVKGELLVGKFDLKECLEEFFKDDESFEFDSRDWDVNRNEENSVMIVNDSGESYDNFVFVKS
jgi:hypothetical protein